MSESKNIESYIYQEGEKRPWYFSTTAVYEAVRNAATALPVSPVVFDKTVDALTAVTTFIKNKTSAKIVVVNRENARELIAKLDGYVKDQLIVMDDGLDHMRHRLASVVRFLIDALVAQRELLDISKLPEKAGRGAAASVEFLLGMFRSAMDTLKTNYPETFEKVSTIATNTYNNVEGKTVALLSSAKTKTEATIDQVDHRITVASAYILRTAQPYVHTAVQRGSPYLATAVEVSQPYVVQAKPYLEPYYEPLVHRAVSATQALQEHKLVGPYVARACESANRAMQDVRVYCLLVEEGQEKGPGGAEDAITELAEGAGQLASAPLKVLPAAAGVAAALAEKIDKAGRGRGSGGGGGKDRDKGKGSKEVKQAAEGAGGLIQEATAGAQDAAGGNAAAVGVAN